jgi:aerobic carbon-monoxide dehydrogenase medium subunit
MTPFDLIEPASLKEAIEQIDPDDPDVRPIAGGTALMLMMKAGVFRPRRLVSLRKLAKTLGNIERARDGELLVGALTPLSVLENSPEIARNVPVITRTMRRLANTRVRNVATVGGALAHGDPHMDLPPVLIALGAEIRVAGPKSERAMKVEDLFTGYYETAIARNELITHVSIPAQGAVRSVYFKVTAGSADDWPALGVAVAIENANAGVKSARIVVSAATTKAMRLKSAEKTLVGGLADEKVVTNAADAAVEEAEIIADLRGSASYKRELLRVYVARAVRSAMQGTSP